MTLKEKALHLYSRIFGRKSFYLLNRALFVLASRGLGYLNYQNLSASGERRFIEKEIKLFEQNGLGDFIVFDVGANVGEYAESVLAAGGNHVRLYCFEPGREAAQELKENLNGDSRATVENVALSNTSGRQILYNIQGNPACAQASLTSSYLNTIDMPSNIISQCVDVIRGDSFCEESKIDHISLLKIDVEGLELKVIQGFKNMIRSGAIEKIQLEFNLTTLFERVLLADIQQELIGYSFYRLLASGELLELDVDSPAIYLFQNLVAVKKIKSDCSD